MLDEQHETSAAESETLSSAVLEEAVAEECAADVQVIQRITRFHMGPFQTPRRSVPTRDYYRTALTES